MQTFMFKIGTTISELCEFKEKKKKQKNTLVIILDKSGILVQHLVLTRNVQNIELIFKSSYGKNHNNPYYIQGTTVPCDIG